MKYYPTKSDQLIEIIFDDFGLAYSNIKASVRFGLVRFRLGKS